LAHTHTTLPRLEPIPVDAGEPASVVAHIGIVNKNRRRAGRKKGTIIINTARQNGPHVHPAKVGTAVKETFPDGGDIGQAAQVYAGKVVTGIKEINPDGGNIGQGTQVNAGKVNTGVKEVFRNHRQPRQIIAQDYFLYFVFGDGKSPICVYLTIKVSTEKQIFTD
jgi:hypothetical protein